MDKLCYYFLPTFFSGTRVELLMLMIIIILIKVDISQFQLTVGKIKLNWNLRVIRHLYIFISSGNICFCCSRKMSVSNLSFVLTNKHNEFQRIGVI